MCGSERGISQTGDIRFEKKAGTQSFWMTERMALDFNLRALKEHGRILGRKLTQFDIQILIIVSAEWTIDWTG